MMKAASDAARQWRRESIRELYKGNPKLYKEWKDYYDHINLLTEEEVEKISSHGKETVLAIAKSNMNHYRSKCENCGVYDEVLTLYPEDKLKGEMFCPKCVSESMKSVKNDS